MTLIVILMSLSRLIYMMSKCQLHYATLVMEIRSFNLILHIFVINDNLLSQTKSSLLWIRPSKAHLP